MYKIYRAYELVHLEDRSIEKYPAPGIQVIKADDHQAALEEKDAHIERLKNQAMELYEQRNALMRQAILFAVTADNMKAKEFLASPVVQAFKDKEK